MNVQPYKLIPIEIILLVVILIPGRIFATEQSARYKAVIISSFEKVEKAMYGAGSFKLDKTQNIDGEVENTTAIYDPKYNSSNPWFLIRFNQVPPTNEQLSEYREFQQEKIIERQKNEKNKYLQFINFETLKVETENDNFIVFAFDAYNKKNLFVKDLIVTSNSSFKVKLVLKVEQWQMSFRFEQVGDLIILREQKSKLAGSALFVDVNVSGELQYTDYVYHNTDIENVKPEYF